MPAVCWEARSSEARASASSPPPPLPVDAEMKSELVFNFNTLCFTSQIKVQKSYADQSREPFLTNNYAYFKNKNAHFEPVHVALHSSHGIRSKAALRRNCRKRLQTAR